MNNAQPLRAELKKLLAAARAGELDAIALPSVINIGRTASQLAKFFGEMERLDVTVRCVAEHLDTGKATGKAVHATLKALAAEELKRAREARTSALRQARDSGRTWNTAGGRSRRRISPEKVQAIQQLHQGGMTVSAIARAVGISRRAVYVVLDSS